MTTLTRRTLLAGLTATLATPAVAAMPTNDTRRLWMTSIHTREAIDITYYANGRYDARALSAINQFMRDWRTGSVIEMDIRAIDIWSALHRATGSGQPFQLISGYRSPKTNGALRTASTGVAKRSLHMRGMAADLRLADRSLGQIARAARAVDAGGIGIYPGSDFVHVDSGRTRQWQG